VHVGEEVVLIAQPGAEDRDDRGQDEKPHCGHETVAGAVVAGHPPRHPAAGQEGEEQDGEAADQASGRQRRVAVRDAGLVADRADPGEEAGE